MSMRTLTQPHYAVECDRCGTGHNNRGYSTQYDARYRAAMDGWRLRLPGARWALDLCPRCATAVDKAAEQDDRKALT